MHRGLFFGLRTTQQSGDPGEGFSAACPDAWSRLDERSNGEQEAFTCFDLNQESNGEYKVIGIYFDEFDGVNYEFIPANYKFNTFNNFKEYCSIYFE